MPRIKPKTHYKAQIVNGRRVKVAMTSKDVKNFIMKVNNWTAEEYRKNYDIFKNKLRAYEAIEARGGEIKKQSVVDVLYAQARAKKLHGADYEPSERMKRIMATSAYSITKGRQMARQERYIKKKQQEYKAYIDKDFEGLIAWARGSSTMIAAQIVQLVDYGTDPIKIHRGLADLATEFEKLRREQGKSIGDLVGSDDSDMAFDISPYLE